MTSSSAVWHYRLWQQPSGITTLTKMGGSPLAMKISSSLYLACGCDDLLLSVNMLIDCCIHSTSSFMDTSSLMWFVYMLYWHLYEMVGLRFISKRLYGCLLIITKTGCWLNFRSFQPTINMSECFYCWYVSKNMCSIYYSSLALEHDWHCSCECAVGLQVADKATFFMCSTNCKCSVKRKKQLENMH